VTTAKIKLEGTLELVTEPEGRCFVTVDWGGSRKVTARGEDMSYTLASGTQVSVQVAYVDAAGNPAAVDGEVTWGSSDGAAVQVAVDAADSTKATVQAVGPVGLVQVTATADADLGAGTRELTTVMDVDVVAGEAVAGTISPTGPAEPIPPTR